MSTNYQNYLATRTCEQLNAMFEQYSEIESRSVGDELKQEMIAHELDAREDEVQQLGEMK